MYYVLTTLSTINIKQYGPTKYNENDDGEYDVKLRHFWFRHSIIS